MKHEFTNQTPVAIDPVLPNTIQSGIVVDSLENAAIAAAEVRVDIVHTWTNDLTIRLKSPKGTSITLAERVGGSRDDFQGTVFRADAQTSISDGRAPFRGNFIPEEDIAALQGEGANGTWTLEITDSARRDGGFLNSWTLGLTTENDQPKPFEIAVRFLGGLSPNQQTAFASAAERWSQIIVGDLPPVLLEGEVIDDVLIEAQGVPIDGPGRILGQAGPRFIRPGSNIPIKGIMSFDTADLDRMESDGSLTDVILHEMAHVLGFGTLWQTMGLIANAGEVNPTFTGTSAMREYGLLRAEASPGNTTAPTPVPVANTGGPGTRDGHWREAVFGDELLTGFISGSVRSISKMSIGCFEDMGYQVDYAAADRYSLPSMLRIAEMGLFGLRQDVDTCAIEPIVPVVVPPSAMVNT